jgi:hypothetical protein
MVGLFFVSERRPFMMMKRTQYHRSLVLAALIGAQPFRCWRNAALTMILFPKLFERGTYVEGWLVIPRSHRVDLVEHGWVTLPEVGILDPSLVLIEDPEQPVLSYPGFEIPGNRFAHEVDRHIFPLVCNSQDGKHGMGHRGYRESYRLARQRAQQLAQQRHLPPSSVSVRTKGGKREMTIIARASSSDAEEPRE